MTWHARSACLGLDPDLFLPERGDTAGVKAALSVCATCEVVDECLAENLEVKDGIYGNTTGAERRRLRESRPKLRTCLDCGATFEGKFTAGFCSDRCRERRRRQLQAASAARVGRPL